MFFIIFLTKNLSLPLYASFLILLLCILLLCCISKKNGYQVEAMTCSWKNTIFGAITVWFVFLVFDGFELSLYMSHYLRPQIGYWIVKIVFLFWLTGSIFRGFVGVIKLKDASWPAFPHLAFYLLICFLFTNYDDIAR